ncbi:MAG: fused MFS/spermidine synthase [Oscillospiraceae bacterium]|nr:fused MFS/spermidine synthase [Oscillospiraceae bacterium]
MKSRPILKNKYYLYLTEFFSGVSVMAVELGASRLLAPYFSSSQIVWTIIIGTIMIAMALGNLWGGREADKNPDPDRLYFRILIAAVWIAAIPVAGKYVILAVSGVLVLTVSTNLLIIAAFLSCMIIFVFPLFLLGTVTPSLVKYTVDSLDNSGKTVGMLGAANTVGSIIGTFLPTFVTIPAVGTSITFLIFSGILLVIALVYFLSGKAGYRASAAAAALFMLCSVFGRSGSFAFWEKDLSYEGESVYNYLQVKENDESVILSTNVLFGVQSVKMKTNSLTGMYYDYALAAPLMAGVDEKPDANVLILGNGTGTYAAQCRKYFPYSEIEGVEIDEKITSLADKYFDMPDDIDIATYDGRAYLSAVDTKYDVILVDAYQDITIPFQMSSAEFFTLVRDHLKEGGVMVVNMNMHSDGEDSINQALTDTVASVFGSVYTADVAGATNREMFASVSGDLRAALRDGTLRQTDFELHAMMDTVCDALTLVEAGDDVLTDDRAPVEMLGMKTLDGYIGSELKYYRELFRTEGFAGIIGNFNA